MQADLSLRWACVRRYIFQGFGSFSNEPAHDKTYNKTSKDSDQPLVCVEVLWPSQPNGVMSSLVSLPNHTFTGQA